MSSQFQVFWNELIHSSLFAIGLTLVIFQAAVLIYRRSGWIVLQPVMLSVAAVVGTLTALDLDYAHYRKAADPLLLLLGPVTIALAVPLFKQIRQIRKLLWPIMVTLVIGGALTVALTIGIAYLLGASLPVQMSLAPRSATMPIAMLVAEQSGGITSLAAAFVMLTGVLGAAMGPKLLNLTGVTAPSARGLSYGINAHAIGTVYAMEEGEECAAFAALGMSATGVLFALFLPWVL